MASTFDATIRHQIRLERAKAGERLATRKLLKQVDNRILEVIKGMPTAYTKSQELAAIAEINKIIDKFYNSNLRDYYLELIGDTVDVERNFSSKMFELFTAGNDDSVTEVSRDAIITAGSKKSYKGHKLSTWSNMLGTEKKKRIKRLLRQGRSDELKKELILKNARRQFGISNKNAQTITSTHINHYSNLTREMYDQANYDLVEVIMWSSILDSSTTDICMKRSDKLYDPKTKEPIGHTHPWLEGPGSIHFGCRSMGIRMNRADVPSRTDGADETTDGGVPVSLIIRG